jgi:hypothetical protein
MNHIQKMQRFLHLAGQFPLPSQSPSGNSDRAFSISGSRDGLRVICVVILDFHAHDLLILVGVLAALTLKGLLIKRDLD